MCVFLFFDAGVRPPWWAVDLQRPVRQWGRRAGRAGGWIHTEAVRPPRYETAGAHKLSPSKSQGEGRGGDGQGFSYTLLHIESFMQIHTYMRGGSSEEVLLDECSPTWTSLFAKVGTVLFMSQFFLYCSFVAYSSIFDIREQGCRKWGPWAKSKMLFKYIGSILIFHNLRDTFVQVVIKGSTITILHLK